VPLHSFVQLQPLWPTQEALPENRSHDHEEPLQLLDDESQTHPCSEMQEKSLNCEKQLWENPVQVPFVEHPWTPLHELPLHDSGMPVQIFVTAASGTSGPTPESGAGWPASMTAEGEPASPFAFPLGCGFTGGLEAPPSRGVTGSVGCSPPSPLEKTKHPKRGRANKHATPTARRGSEEGIVT
jgi:hypothetical protein